VSFITDDDDDDDDDVFCVRPGAKGKCLSLWDSEESMILTSLTSSAHSRDAPVCVCA